MKIVLSKKVLSYNMMFIFSSKMLLSYNRILYILIIIKNKQRNFLNLLLSKNLEILTKKLFRYF